VLQLQCCSPNNEPLHNEEFRVVTCSPFYIIRLWPPGHGKTYRRHFDHCSPVARASGSESLSSLLNYLRVSPITMEDLPSVEHLIELLLPYVDWPTLPALRLSGTAGRAAIDKDPRNCPNVFHVRNAKHLQRQDSVQHSTCAGSIQHLQIDIHSAADWRQLEMFAPQLPSLSSLRCYGLRQWPPSLSSSQDSTGDGAGDTGAALPQLRSLSFAGTVTSLRPLHRMAPYLQDLYCDALVLGSTEDAGSLTSLRTLGATFANILSFADIFPQLTATYQLPEGPSSPRPNTLAGLQGSMWPCVDGVSILSLRKLGGQSGWLQAINADPERARAVQGLQCLTWHNMQHVKQDMRVAKHQLGLSHLSSLQRVSLSFPLAKAATTRIFWELGKLPMLRHLALPATLLCTACNPWGRSVLLPLLQQQQQHAGHSSTGAPQHQGLQELLLLYRPKAAGHTLGPYCKHLDKLDWAELIPSLVTAAAGAVQAGDGQQHQGEGQATAQQPISIKLVALPLDLSHVGVQPGSQSCSAGRVGAVCVDAVWGALGPEWYV